jgi:site-specific DNA-methyltransferase (adenine-specific)
MKNELNRIEIINEDQQCLADIYDQVIINTYFEISDLTNTALFTKNNVYIKKTISMIESYAEKLKDGGLLFIYGLPKFLPYFSTHLSRVELNGYKYLFKNWIGLDNNLSDNYNMIKNSHIGLLMYLKTKSIKHPTPFYLNTKEVRVPYTNCKACGNNI